MRGKKIVLIIGILLLILGGIAVSFFLGRDDGRVSENDNKKENKEVVDVLEDAESSEDDVQEEVSAEDERANWPAEKRRMENMYSFCKTVEAFEEKYDFSGALESNIENYMLLQKDIEGYLDELITKGNVVEYGKDTFSYLIVFEDDFEYIYSAPFEIEGFWGGGGSTVGATMNVDEAYLTTEMKNVGVKGPGKVLTLEPASNDRQATNSLVPAAQNISLAGLDYSIDSYKAEDCNDLSKLMPCLFNLDQYDVILMEAHGAYYPDCETKRQRIKVTQFLPFDEIMNFTLENPEYALLNVGDLRRIPGIVLANAQYDVATREQIEDPNYEKYLQTNENGIIEVVDSLQIWISEDFFRYAYQDKALKDCFIYICACKMGNASDLANVLINSGASAVMVYKNYVENTYSANMVESIMANLTTVNPDTNKLYTIEDSVAMAKDVHGKLDPSYSNLFQAGYEFVWDRAELLLFTQRSDLRLKDYRTVTSTKIYDEEMEVVTYLKGEDSTEYIFLTEDELIQANDEYVLIKDKLDEEGSVHMADALKYAMNLYFIVSCDNGYHYSLSKHKENAKLDGLGCAYFSDIIRAYNKKNKISYYNLLYIDGQYGSANVAMEGYMEAIGQRNASLASYTDAEMEALALIKKYINTFYANKGNLESVISCLDNYINNHSEKDNNRLVISDNKGKYQNGMAKYFELLEQLSTVEAVIRK